ncbi:MAG: hypothetical protein GC159_15670 [Phycisphaera sp.]|nr:hypothetical protein [Phycisphaera sp.]
MKPPLPGDAAPFAFGDDPSDPQRRPDAPSLYILGTALFIASLIMLFGATMVGYLQSIPADAHLKLPPALWLSTGVLLVSGVTIHLAARAARAADARRTFRMLAVTAGVALVFIAVQTPCMIALLHAHAQAAAASHVGVYGLTFTLIILHALHVLGGVVPMGWLLYAAKRRGRDLTARPGAIRACAMYWHFLEIVWLVMFVTFLTI